MALINTRTCTSIQCGATTQLEAGMQEIMDCSAIGYSGVRSCLDPLCINDLAPSYCNPDRIPPIPYSPANDKNNYIFAIPDVMQVPSNTLPEDVSAMVDRTGSSYQDMVECPNSETGLFMVGMDSWRSLSSILDKFQVISDLPFMEMLGFLTPALVIGVVGYNTLKRR